MQSMDDARAAEWTRTMIDVVFLAGGAISLLLALGDSAFLGLALAFSGAFLVFEGWLILAFRKGWYLDV